MNPTNFSSNFDPSSYFGHTVFIRTTEGEEYVGEFYCYNTSAEFVVLKEDNKNGTANFYILRISIIEDIGIKKRLKNAYDPLPHIDKNIIHKIEEHAKMNYEKNRARIGIGVTQEAQELFDFIWKTHPDCVWNNKDILVLNGEVSIKPPYGPENCVAKNEKLKERFTTVITKFRQKKHLTNKE